MGKFYFKLFIYNFGRVSFILPDDKVSLISFTVEWKWNQTADRFCPLKFNLLNCVNTDTSEQEGPWLQFWFFCVDMQLRSIGNSKLPPHGRPANPKGQKSLVSCNRPWDRLHAPLTLTSNKQV